MGKEHSPTAAVVLGGGHLDGGGDSALITHHRAAVTSNGDTRVKHLQVPVTGQSSLSTITIIVISMPGPVERKRQCQLRIGACRLPPTRIRTRSTAAADLQTPLKGVQGGDQE